VTGTPVETGNIDCWYYHSRSALCRSLFPSATDAFVAPPGGVFGNAGRNVLRGAGAVVFDFSLHRSFPLGSDARQLEFRWEMFNLTNTPQFGLPDRNVTGSSPGSITTLANDPRIMQFALRLKF